MIHKIESALFILVDVNHSEQKKESKFFVIFSVWMLMRGFLIFVTTSDLKSHS